jgi:hypothetical protein
MLQQWCWHYPASWSQAFLFLNLLMQQKLR